MSEAARLRAIAAAANAVAERWSLPAVDGPIIGSRRPGPSAEAQARAREAEHARGYETGLAAARAELAQQIAEAQARVQRLDALLAQLARPLAALEDEVYEELTRLALAVGKQLARRELSVQPTQIIALIREAVGQLPASAREVRVHLHPEDAAVVREHLVQPGEERAWSVLEDPTQARGGCLVRSASSQLDARFESRVQAIVASLCGDARARPRTHEDAPGEQGGGARLDDAR